MKISINGVELKELGMIGAFIPKELLVNYLERAVYP